jgi:hypothetical protein
MKRWHFGGNVAARLYREKLPGNVEQAPSPALLKEHPGAGVRFPGPFLSKKLISAGGAPKFLIGTDRQGRQAGLLALLVRGCHVLPVNLINLLILFGPGLGCGPGAARGAGTRGQADGETYHGH